MAQLKLEIIQEPAFFSVEEEAFLNLLRSADCLQRAFHRKTRDWGLTSTQYNVLRILRGAHPNGLTCAAIGTRMIAAEPDITRLLGRLKTQGLIEQKRDELDRRVVWTKIAASGLDLLGRMDPVIERVPIELLGHMSPQELKEMIRLLEVARGPEKDSGCPETCPLAEEEKK
jgi:DNA-binding MarR family transcriptional regulator